MAGGRHGRAKQSTFKRPQDFAACSFRPEGIDGGPNRTPRSLKDRVFSAPLRVKSILAVQMRKKKNYYHVEWEGSIGNTWEPVDHLQHSEGIIAIQDFERASAVFDQLMHNVNNCCLLQILFNSLIKILKCVTE